MGTFERVRSEEPDDRDRQFDHIVGNSPALQSALAEVQRVAPTDSTVLVLGETGTGKELIAHAIHNLSVHCGRPFVDLNCVAIPFDPLESELFGHENGAFTGPVMQKIGRFETADTGTPFLDEIGDLPLALQPKLAGMLNKQIAAQFGTAESAVRVQPSRAMEKMQAESFAELIRMIQQFPSEKRRKPKLTRILLFAVQEIPRPDTFFPVRGITSVQLELRMLTNLISVVDDDASVRKTTILLIESFGFQTAGFESAELFLKSGQLHETSCLIVDVRMPGMNGVQLRSHLAALGCKISIIFITAYDDKASRRRALQAGAVAFLGKPFSDELSLQAIRAALRQNEGSAKTT